MVRKHKGVRYETRDPMDYIWTMKAVTEQREGALKGEIVSREGVRFAKVTGACPRCGGNGILWNRNLDGVVGTSGTLGDKDRRENNTVSVDVPCGCGFGHKGSPVGVTGCGVIFRVEVRADPHA
jgi:hypothetical protein